MGGFQVGMIVTLWLPSLASAKAEVENTTAFINVWYYCIPFMPADGSQRLLAACCSGGTDPQRRSPKHPVSFPKNN